MSTPPKKMKNVYHITPDDDGIKLRKWIRKTFPSIPLSALHKFLRTKKIRRNGERAKGEETLTSGDIIRIFFYPEQEELQKDKNQEKKKIPFSLFQKYFFVLFEDEDLLIINKPFGIPVHPGSKTRRGRSIIELAQEKYQQENIRLFHRLDKDTSGVLLLTKNGGALRELGKNTRSTFYKEYYTLVLGTPSQKNSTIDIPLKKTEKRKKIVVGSGKKSVTHYQVEETFPCCSFVKVVLETGRTHQIRTHFSAIGHPVLGDDKHGNFKQNAIFSRKYKLKRQFLHASTLSFLHPKTQERLTIHAKFPEDLQTVLTLLSEDID
jgi:RluA family pseudouridine synthase